MEEYLASSKKSKKKIIFRFLLSPKQILADRDKRFRGVVFTRNQLAGKPHEQLAIPAAKGSSEEISGQILFRSLGYETIPVPGLNFDSKLGRVPNAHGCVLTTESANHIEIGLYVAGWAKSGAYGTVASSFRDSIETVINIRSHVMQKYLELKEDPIDGILEETSSAGKEVTSYGDWKTIDQYELERGKETNKVREKYGSVPEFFKILQVLQR
jgi:ferredoxin--NADP+ reductase